MIFNDCWWQVRYVGDKTLFFAILSPKSSILLLKTGYWLLKGVTKSILLSPITSIGHRHLGKTSVGDFMMKING